jgi:hypothetical protein
VTSTSPACHDRLSPSAILQNLQHATKKSLRVEGSLRCEAFGPARVTAITECRSSLWQSVGSVSVSGNEHFSNPPLERGNPVDVGTPSISVAIFDNSLFFDESFNRWRYIFGYVQVDMIKRKLCDLLAGRTQRATAANRVIDDPVQFVRIQHHVAPLLSLKHITARWAWGVGSVRKARRSMAVGLPQSIAPCPSWRNQVAFNCDAAARGWSGWHPEVVPLLILRYGYEY